MSLISKTKIQYEKNGYIIIKNLLDQDLINKCLSTIKNLPPKVLVPFSEEAWGFGSLDEHKPFDEVNKKILNTIKSLEILDKNIKLNYLICNRKPGWIGPSVHYHQEVLLSKTFASGASHSYLRNKLMQVYLPLHSETSSNGGLRVITNTHKLDALESEDMICPQFGHKKRIKNKILDLLIQSDEHQLIDVNLEAGDCLLFSLFLVHASPSNGLPGERVSIVSQAKPIDFEPDQKIFKEDTDFRKSFVVEELSKISKKIMDPSRYMEFNKK